MADGAYRTSPSAARAWASARVAPANRSVRSAISLVVSARIWVVDNWTICAVLTEAGFKIEKPQQAYETARYATLVGPPAS